MLVAKTSAWPVARGGTTTVGLTTATRAETNDIKWLHKPLNANLIYLEVQVKPQRLARISMIF
jgi:hypothetical protein